MNNILITHHFTNYTHTMTYYKRESHCKVKVDNVTIKTALIRCHDR